MYAGMDKEGGPMHNNQRRTSQVNPVKPHTGIEDYTTDRLTFTSRVLINRAIAKESLASFITGATLLPKKRKELHEIQIDAESVFSNALGTSSRS